MTGYYKIGDLSFSIEGTFKELAQSQNVVREISRAESKLMQVSGAEEVYVVCDRDIQGEHGTFDMLRLRAYSNGRCYTVNLGVTDKNPLEVFVSGDKKIQEYDYDEQRVIDEYTLDSITLASH